MKCNVLLSGKNSKKLCEALAACNTSPDEIRAIFITHEHGDHFHMTHPNTNWRACVAHGEKLGLGTREYELVKI